MIISNDSGFDITIRWNEYLRQNIADIVIDDKTHSVPIREGVQVYRGIRMETEVANCVRSDCDLKDAGTRFSLV